MQTPRTVTDVVMKYLGHFHFVGARVEVLYRLNLKDDPYTIVDFEVETKDGGTFKFSTNRSNVVAVLGDHESHAPSGDTVDYPPLGGHNDPTVEL